MVCVELQSECCSSGRLERSWRSEAGRREQGPADGQAGKVTGAAPVEESVMVCLAVCPTVTLPKLTLFELTVSVRRWRVQLKRECCRSAVRRCCKSNGLSRGDRGQQ